MLKTLVSQDEQVVVSMAGIITGLDKWTSKGVDGIEAKLTKSRSIEAGGRICGMWTTL